jgi:hypothetical protein
MATIDLNPFENLNLEFNLVCSVEEHNHRTIDTNDGDTYTGLTLTSTIFIPTE